MSADVAALLERCPVMPVLVIDDAQDAVPLARALRAGGIDVLEITLRTPAALDAIRLIAREVDDVLVGAGTVLTVHQLTAVENAGGRFAISPGMSASLLSAGMHTPLAYLPAISTVSELMGGIDAGFHSFKFFPAKYSGGVGMLKSLHDVFPNARFCPTGGIRYDDYLDYLALDNVPCVGGSWIAPRELIRNQQWSAITDLARTVIDATS